MTQKSHKFGQKKTTEKKKIENAPIYIRICFPIKIKTIPRPMAMVSVCSSHKHNNPAADIFTYNIDKVEYFPLIQKYRMGVYNVKRLSLMDK